MKGEAVDNNASVIDPVSGGPGQTRYMVTVCINHSCVIEYGTLVKMAVESNRWVW